MNSIGINAWQGTHSVDSIPECSVTLAVKHQPGVIIGGQFGCGRNPWICGTLAARDGIKTGTHTPNGQDASDGKLIIWNRK